MNIHQNLFSSADSASGYFPVSAFSAFHFLKNYNYLITPQAPDPTILPRPIITSQSDLGSETVASSHFTGILLPQKTDVHQSLSPSFCGIAPSHVLPTPTSATKISSLLENEQLTALPTLLETSETPLHLQSNSKRHRGEKKPIPNEQKDDRYYERRRRNNEAAKKSRDARKFREDQIAIRATLLEHENAMLKAQVLTLKEEASTLRQLVYRKSTVTLSSSTKQAA